MIHYGELRKMKMGEIEKTSNSLDERYIRMAELVSLNSPCFRSKVGAVIVHDGMVLTTGFNIAPRNQFDCRKIGWCFRDANHIVSGTRTDQCRAIGSHAESNAIASASRKGIGTNNATMYIFGNTDICPACRGIITNSGIKMVIYKSKTGIIQKINVEYDWSIHPLDQKRKFEDWKNNLENEQKSWICLTCNIDFDEPIIDDATRCPFCFSEAIQQREDLEIEMISENEGKTFIIKDKNISKPECFGTYGYDNAEVCDNECNCKLECQEITYIQNTN